MALAVLAGVVTWIGGAARADHTDQVDPNDVGGLLDLEEVTLRHGIGPYVWVFRTYSKWTTKKIWDDGFFVVRLDTRGSPEADYLALLRSTGKQMQGELFRVRSDGSHKRVRALDAWRVGPTGTGIQVPARFLVIGVDRPSFLWWTASLFTSERCRRPCIDAVPDEGTLEQVLIEEVVG